MTNKPFGMTIFCDDIRQETNGNFILIGANPREEIIFNKVNNAHCMIPLLGFYVKIYIPIDLKFHSITVYARQEDNETKKTLFKIEHTKENFPPAPPKSHDNKPFYAKLTFVQRIPGIICHPNGLIKVRMTIDEGKPIPLGIIIYKFAEKQNP